jgi:hypothetical protein
VATYPLNPGDIVEGSIRGAVLGQVVMTVLHYQATLAAPIADGIAALTTAETAFSVGAGSPLVKYRGCTATNYASQFVRFQVVYPTRRPYFQVARNAAGTFAPDCEAPNLSAFLNLQALNAGRGRHGGIHFPAPSSGGYTAGNVAGALGVAIRDFVTAWSPGLNISAGNDLIPIIWSRVKPTTPSAIIGTSIQQTIRTMHRRTVGLGI